MRFDLANARVITVVYDTQAPDVFFRESDFTGMWTHMSFSPHEGPPFEQYQIHRELLLEKLMECKDDPGIQINVTKFSGR